MNIKKLLSYNLKRPLHQRIDSVALRGKESVAAARGNMVALQASIHAEIADQREKLYSALDFGPKFA